MGTFLTVLLGILKIIFLFIDNRKQQDAVIKDKKKEIIGLTKEAFTGDIKSAKSKMAAAIDKLGDLK